MSIALCKLCKQEGICPREELCSSDELIIGKTREMKNNFNYYKPYSSTTVNNLHKVTQYGDYKRKKIGDYKVTKIANYNDLSSYKKV